MNKRFGCKPWPVYGPGYFGVWDFEKNAFLTGTNHTRQVQILTWVDRFERGILNADIQGWRDERGNRV